MSYLVLARKYRPQRFPDVVGQAAVVKTLQNAIRRGRVAHAMIFSGVRGTGKTTLARIMAKALSCQEEQDRPCDRCESCREITAGISLDLHEIDGASNRGIQEIRELKENIRFLPAKSRFKIYIIDEVHMLTTEAFNALLKTLEEPPEHVYFMFATTELHKVPVTILSRCQRYELKRIAFGELFSFFQKIARAEEIAVSEAALRMIAREAAGSVRDGLSLLDQVFSFGGESIDANDVTEVLGVVDRTLFLALVRALLGRDLATAMELLDRSCSAGIDLKRLANDLVDCFRAVLVRKSCRPETVAAILEGSDQELAEIAELAAGQSGETLYQYFQLMLKGVEELRYAAQPRLALEMVFIRLTQAGQVTPVAEVLAMLDTLLGKTPVARPVAAMASPNSASFVGGGQKIPAVDAPARSAVAPVLAEKKTAAKAVTAGEPEKTADRPVAPEISAALETKLQPPTLPPPPPPPPPPPAAPVVIGEGKDVRRHWEEFVDYVKERKTWMAHVLRLCAGVKEKDSVLVLKFDSLSDAKILQQPENMKSLTEFAQDFFQRELSIRFAVKGGDLPTTDDSGHAPQEERRKLAGDPLVQLATEIFGGQVTNIRTGPKSR